MAVIIQNISLHIGKDAISQYEVRINRELIATFQHYRGDGLEACLRRAADAVAETKHPNPYATYARSQDREEQ